MKNFESKDTPMGRVSQGAGLLLEYPVGLLGRKVFAVVAAAGLLIAGAGVVHADIVYNDVDGTADAVAEVMSLNVGGTKGTTTLSIIETDRDGKQNCNIT